MDVDGDYTSTLADGIEAREYRVYLDQYAERTAQWQQRTAVEELAARDRAMKVVRDGRLSLLGIVEWFD